MYVFVYHPKLYMRYEHLKYFPFNHFDNDHNISTIKSVYKSSYRKGKRLIANCVGIHFFNEAALPKFWVLNIILISNSVSLNCVGKHFSTSVTGSTSINK